MTMMTSQKVNALPKDWWTNQPINQPTNQPTNKRIETVEESLEYNWTGSLLPERDALYEQKKQEPMKKI